MRVRWLLATCAIVVAAATAAGLHSLGALPPADGARRVPAQELPLGTAGLSPFEVRWAPGVLQAANMYFPAELEMLEVVHSEPTKQQAVELVTRIGMPLSPEALAQLPEQSIAEKGCYRWRFGPLDLNVFRDGNLGLFWPDRDPVREHFTNPNAKAASALTVDEAVAIADAFVKDAGLLPDGARMTDVVPKIAVHRYNDATGKDETTVLALSVIYRRFHDGIPEGSIGVSVNGEGEIVKVNRNMRNLRSLGRYPILRPEEARAMIWSPTSRVELGTNAPRYRPVKAAIEQVQMEYYDGATAWRYDTIQPVYIFTGSGRDGAGRPNSFTAMVPAVRPEFLEPVDLPGAGGAAVGSAASVAPGAPAKHAAPAKAKPR
ncbi:MAG: hypothetical protein ABSD48_07115 [Armatimonadota bacterium]|jgi:hypothetical protein